MAKTLVHSMAALCGEFSVRSILITEKYIIQFVLKLIKSSKFLYWLCHCTVSNFTVSNMPKIFGAELRYVKFSTQELPYSHNKIRCRTVWSFYLLYFSWLKGKSWKDHSKPRPVKDHSENGNNQTWWIISRSISVVLWMTLKRPPTSSPLLMTGANWKIGKWDETGNFVPGS